MQAIREMEARLEASSPDLARRLVTASPTPRVTPPDLVSDRARLAAILVAMAVSLSLATVIASMGVQLAVAAALLVAEMVGLLTVAHFAGPRLNHRMHRRRRNPGTGS